MENRRPARHGRSGLPRHVWPGPGKTELVNLSPSLYPLHPTLIPALSKFFRRFGQNERSLFSFILSSEPFALQDFAERLAGKTHPTASLISTISLPTISPTGWAVSATAAIGTTSTRSSVVR